MPTQLPAIGGAGSAHDRRALTQRAPSLSLSEREAPAQITVVEALEQLRREHRDDMNKKDEAHRQDMKEKEDAHKQEMKERCIWRNSWLRKHLQHER